MQFDPQSVPLSRYRRVGDLVFLSGQIAIDRNGAMVAPDIQGQTRRVLENISAVLADAAARSRTWSTRPCGSATKATSHSSTGYMPNIFRRVRLPVPR